MPPGRQVEEYRTGLARQAQGQNCRDVGGDQRYCTWVRNLETPRHCLKYFHEYLNAARQEQMGELDRDIHAKKRMRCELEKRAFVERTRRSRRLNCRY